MLEHRLPHRIHQKYRMDLKGTQDNLQTTLKEMHVYLTLSVDLQYCSRLPYRSMNIQLQMVNPDR
eukprot:Gb_33478 [translate_table: standard]